jgi:hypothetical protein
MPIACELRPAAAAAYPSIVTATLTVVAIVFGLLGVLSALAFPTIGTASVTAYLALHYAPHNAVVAAWFTATNAIVSLALLLTFPLQLTPVAKLVDDACGLRTLTHRRLGRLAAVVLCTLLVLAVPRLETLIDLTGAATNTTLAALPVVMALRVRVLERRAASAAFAACAAGAEHPEAGLEEAADSGGRATHDTICLAAAAVYLAFLCAVGVSGVSIALGDAIGQEGRRMRG